MSAESSPELRRELLDDFYAECDELLLAIREGLGHLDEARQAGKATKAIVEALFRNTHSLKGISAIVGLRPAEQVAHASEDVLRGLSRRAVALSAPLVDQLMAGTQALEGIITTHRLGKPVPDPTEISNQLMALLPPEAASVSSAPEVAPAEPAVADPALAARQRGLFVHTLLFSPSPERDSKGINVAATRERLTAAGEILSATPKIGAGGSFQFEFVVGFRVEPKHEEWNVDGLSLAEPAVQPAALPAEPIETLALTPSHIVRVDLARLDVLMRITGELVIQRSRLVDRIAQLQGGKEALDEVSLGLGRLLREMREGIAKVRMVPVAEIFTRMPFVVRDLVRGSRKQARVVLEGHQTEIDKFLVERLKEPLLHLVRNAFAHGVELPADREAAGKPPEATITLRARSVGDSIIIQVSDDGGGINPAAVVAKARAAGLTLADHPEPAALLRVLCAPGFSTRDGADLSAGRGVGMAVVETTVRELGGTLKLESTPGKGSEFTLKIPLTLSIADAIIVRVGGETFAVPQSAVDEMIQRPADQICTIKSTDLVPYRGGLLPIIRLTKAFRLKTSEDSILTLLVVSSERGSTGLVVDRIEGQREIVIRSLADPLVQVPGIAGATELGDGHPILILDVVSLTEGVVLTGDPVSTAA